MLKRYGVFVGVLAMVCIVSIASFGQDAGSVSTQVQETAASALDQSLTYIDSAATYLVFRGRP